MRHILTAVVFFASLCGMYDSVCAASAPAAPPKIAVAGKSIRIDGVEVCTEKDGYISLEALQKVLGPYEEMYAGGLGVQVYAWPAFGIHVQRGWRGPDRDKIFKFQVWFVDSHSRDEDKNTGCFAGEIVVDGLRLGAHSALRQIRPDLEKARFLFEEEPGFIKAGNGPVSIFTVAGTDALQRIEVWTVD